MSLTLSPKPAPPLLVPPSVNAPPLPAIQLAQPEPQTQVSDLSLFIRHIHSHTPFCEVCCLNIRQFSSVLSWFRPSAYLNYSSGPSISPCLVVIPCHAAARLLQKSGCITPLLHPLLLGKGAVYMPLPPGSLHPFPLD